VRSRRALHAERHFEAALVAQALRTRLDVGAAASGDRCAGASRCLLRGSSVYSRAGERPRDNAMTPGAMRRDPWLRDLRPGADRPAGAAPARAPSSTCCTARGLARRRIGRATFAPSSGCSSTSPVRSACCGRPLACWRRRAARPGRRGGTRVGRRPDPVDVVANGAPSCCWRSCSASGWVRRCSGWCCEGGAMSRRPGSRVAAAYLALVAVATLLYWLDYFTPAGARPRRPRVHAFEERSRSRRLDGRGLLLGATACGGARPGDSCAGCSRRPSQVSSACSACRST